MIDGCSPSYNCKIKKVPFVEALVFHMNVLIVGFQHNTFYQLTDSNYFIGLASADIDSIELVGEATRIPCCIE